MPKKRPEPTSRRPLDATVRRASEIVASLRAGDLIDVFDAFWQLDALPLEEVRDALAPWTGALPELDRLDMPTRLAHGMPLRPLRLRALSVAQDADILDLGPVAEEQLRLAGKSWDGVDLAPEERLDGEIEGSFAGTLERRVLVDADAPHDVPLFDVLLFAGDSGVVFAAGTTKIVAPIAYGKVELRDRRTRSALEEAVAATAPSDESGPADEQTVPKKTSANKTRPKAPAKKTPVKKTPAKKASAKKTPAKKTPAKKRAAKSKVVASKRAKR